MGRTIALLLLITKLSLAATYDVPAPKGLEDEARWEIGAKATLEGDKLSVGYHLPDDLIGKNDGIHFTGTVKDGFAPVSGTNVRGTCMVSEGKPLTCLLKYPGLQMNNDSAEESLRAHFTGSKLDLRTRLSRLFRGDPAGLLMVEFR